MISREEVLTLAALARLKLSEAEVADLQKDISSILDYVGQVSNVTAQSGQASPRSNLGAPAHRNVMREDTPYGSDLPVFGKREALVQAFPKREGDYNVVRKIIQKDE